MTGGDFLDDGLLHTGPVPGPTPPRPSAAEATPPPATPSVQAAAEVGDGNDDDEDDGAGSKLHFPTVYAFVADFLVHVYPRQVRDQDTGFNWCSRWFLHPGALARLEAVWKAFEALRLEPGVAASTWWNDHADPCMAVLTDPAGPFTRCGPGKHQSAPPLPTDDPPAWLLETPGSTTCPGG